MYSRVATEAGVRLGDARRSRASPRPAQDLKGPSLKLPSEVWALSLISFLSAAGMGLVAPVLPALAEEFGVGIAAMSVAVSGFAAARLVTTLALTRALRRLRLRPVLAAGLGFQAVTTVISGLATDYTWFIVFRSLSGIGSAAFTISATALLVALAPADRRGRAMSLYGSASGMGIVGGPAIGGALGLAQPHLPLLVYGSALGLGSLVTIFLLRRAGDLRTVDEVVTPLEGGGTGSAATPPRRGGAAVRLLRDPLFRVVLACQVVQGWVHYGLRIAIIPSYLATLGHGLGFIGAGLSVAAAAQLASTSAGGSVSDRIGRKPILLASCAVALSGMTLFVFATPAWVALLAFCAMGLSSGAQQSSSSALLADSANGRSAAAAGAFWMTFDVAGIVGPVVSGFLVETVGVPWAFGASGLVILVAFLVTVRMPRPPAAQAHTA